MTFERARFLSFPR